MTEEWKPKTFTEFFRTLTKKQREDFFNTVIDKAIEEQKKVIEDAKKRDR